MYRNVLTVVLTVSVLAAVAFLCTCSRGGRSGITNAAASLSGTHGDAHNDSQSAVSQPDGSNAPPAADPDHPRIDELDREEGISLETDAGVFTLFVVDKYNRPDREAAAGFEMAFDAATGTLTVGADLCVCPPGSETRNGAGAHAREGAGAQAKKGAHAGAPLQDSFYFVLYYDNTRLAPTGSEYGAADAGGERVGILGASTDVLTLAMMNEPGHIEYAIARVNPDLGVRNASFSLPSETQVSDNEIGFWSGKLPSRYEGATRVAHSKSTAFSVSFSPSPFLASRSTSTVEERRRNMAPIDFVPQDNTDGSFALNWTERNVGDYDGSGEVGVPDITPIAQNYLKRIDDATTPLVRELYEQIDGDKSGDIGVADITPIANNYLNRVEGYDLWRAGASDKEWLPNKSAPGAQNQDTASAPRPDSIDPNREALDLAPAYDYLGAGGVRGTSSDGGRDASAANQNYFYIASASEDGNGELPPGVSLSFLPLQDAGGAPDVHFSVLIAGSQGPFRIAIFWGDEADGERPEFFEKINGKMILCDGSDEPIPHTYDELGKYRPIITIIDNSGFAFAQTLPEITVAYHSGEIPAPQNLRAEGDGTVIYALWDEVAYGNLKGYNVYYSPISNDEAPARYNEDPLTSNSIKLWNNLDPQTTYYIKVRTVDKLGELSAFTEEIAATIGDTDAPPQPATGLNYTFDESVLNLTWNASVSADIAGYRVFRALESEPANETEITTSPRMTLTLDDPTVVTGNNYIYTVESVDNASQTARSAPLNSHTFLPANVFNVLKIYGSISGQEAQFMAQVSGSYPMTYSWNFGGGADPNISTDVTPKVTLGDFGYYEASVTVDNEWGDPSRLAFVLEVLPMGPASVESVTPLTGRTGNQLTFSALVHGQEPMTYDWNFGGGASPNTSADISPTVTLGAIGSYAATLTLDNDFGKPHVFNFILNVTQFSETDFTLEQVPVTYYDAGSATIKYRIEEETDGLAVVAYTDDAIDLTAYLIRLGYDPAIFSYVDNEVIFEFNGILSSAFVDGFNYSPGIVEYSCVAISGSLTGSADLARFYFTFGPQTLGSKYILPVDGIGTSCIECHGFYGNVSTYMDDMNQIGGDLHWEYYNDGDTDQDGVIDYRDFVPIGVHFSEPGKNLEVEIPHVLDTAAEVCDTDYNGEVGITDITPIMLNLGNSIDSWNIYESANVSEYPLNPDDPSLVLPIDTISFSEASGQADVERFVFRFDKNLKEGYYYWVRPVSGGVEGTASDYIVYGL